MTGSASGAARRLGYSIYVTSFTDLGLAAPLLRALEESGYTTPTPIQAQAIPARARRARPPRHRPDRHRQDRRLRPAHPAPARRQGRPAAARRLPRADPLADPGAGLADRRCGEDLRRPPRLLRRHRLRRRAAWPADAAPCSAGVDIVVATPGRLLDHHRRRHRPARPGRDAGPRRGRPDAGQGLPARHPQADPDPAAPAPDAVLLGHHAGRDRPPRRRPAEQPRPRRGGPGRHHRGARLPAHPPRRDRPQARPAGEAPAPAKASAAPWSSPAPSTAPTAW